MFTTAGIMITLWAAVTADAPAAAPAFTEIVPHVLTATAPVQDYEVGVVQTMTGKASTETKPDAAPAAGPQRFTLLWTPAKGHSIRKDEGQAGSSAAPAPRVQVQIDVPRFLQDMLKWPEVTVASETLDGRPCYRVSGKGPQGALTGVVWVDQERWCVPKLTLEMNGRGFAEAVFEHRRVNDQYWLPSKAVVTHAQDGSVVVQEFGEYRFEKK